MRIVQARPEHVPGIMHVIAACIRAMRAEGIDQWDEVYPGEALIARDAAAGTLYVAEAQVGACLGAVCLNEEENPGYAQVPWAGGAPVLVVHRLCVDPACQGQGVAGRLMEFTEALAAARGYTSIRLDAYTGNPVAVRLYERRGYRMAGTVCFPRRTLPFYCFEKIVGEAAPTARRP
jgi:GNAT superfamily N-acetyltransferase